MGVNSTWYNEGVKEVENGRKTLELYRGRRGGHAVKGEGRGGSVLTKGSGGTAGDEGERKKEVGLKEREGEGMLGRERRWVSGVLGEWRCKGRLTSHEKWRETNEKCRRKKIKVCREEHKIIMKERWYSAV